jgi:hypothetical protein
MILLVDLCYREDSLGFEEFVLPIWRIVERCGFSSKEIHYSRIRSEIGRSEAVVLCGTPLADNQFLVDIRQFSWLPACPATGTRDLCRYAGCSPWSTAGEL